MTNLTRMTNLLAPLVTWMLLSSAIFTLFFVSGCSSSAPSVSSRSDMETDSDEPASKKRARIRLELATGYFDKGQTAVALDEVKLSIAADPGLFEAYNLRGLIYMRLNDVSLAEGSFQRALAINSRAATVYHNYGWLLCHNGRMLEASQLFDKALANPTYGDRAKTFMAMGLCYLKNGDPANAEASLLRAYELDAGNPVIGYNLALVLFQRGEFVRSQFHVRRLNNSSLANAETLWLGIKVEHRVENREAMMQLVGQLKKRYPESRELAAYERGAFDE